MQLGIRGVAFTQLAALLSIVSTTFLASCSTASFTAADEVPANYRRQIADYMRTQRNAFSDSLLFMGHPAFPHGISKDDHAEISDPHRAQGYITVWHVCVRLNFSIVWAYGFNDRKLRWETTGIVGGDEAKQALICGTNPNWKPFAEAEFQPQPQPRS